MNWRGDNPISHLSGAFASGLTDDAKFFGEEFDFSARLDQSSKVRSPIHHLRPQADAILQARSPPVPFAQRTTIRAEDSLFKRLEEQFRSHNSSLGLHESLLSMCVPSCTTTLDHSLIIPVPQDHRTAHTHFQARIHIFSPHLLRPTVFHSEVPWRPPPAQGRCSWNTHRMQRSSRSEVTSVARCGIHWGKTN